MARNPGLRITIVNPIRTDRGRNRQDNLRPRPPPTEARNARLSGPIIGILPRCCATATVLEDKIHFSQAIGLDAVRRGTCRSLRSPLLKVAAKTGTRPSHGSGPRTAVAAGREIALAFFLFDQIVGTAILIRCSEFEGIDRRRGSHCRLTGDCNYD